MLLLVSKTNEFPINRHIWVASTTLKQLHNLLRTTEIKLMTILRLAESFKTMNRLDPT